MRQHRHHQVITRSFMRERPYGESRQLSRHNVVIPARTRLISINRDIFRDKMSRSGAFHPPSIAYRAKNHAILAG
jgi:hypothetical protein